MTSTKSGGITFEFPTNTQSLNPYSYVLNNPLSMTDPTGYAPTCITNADGQQTCTETAQTTATDLGSHIAQHGTTTFTGTMDKGGNLQISASGNGFHMGETATVTMRGNGAQTTQGAADAQTKPAQHTDIGSPAQTQAEQVFKHYTANDDMTYTPSPFDKESVEVLQKYLASPVGKVVGDYALAHEVKIRVAEEPLHSKYPPDFFTDSNDVINYSLNWRDLPARTTLAGEREFKGLSGQTLLTDLIAHEVAHTGIGSAALGKPYYDGPFNINEEFNAVRYGENPYRQYIHVPLRRSYSGFSMPAPILINPGG